MKKLLLLFCLLSTRLFSIPTHITEYIKIDQFGYRKTDEKIAVIVSPQTGYNANPSFIPGNNFQLRDWFTDSVVFSSSISAWNGGSTFAQSGDKAWWFDFTNINTEGDYYVYDVTNDLASYRFRISDCIFDDALEQACRMFYYQRCGSAKTSMNAGAGWSDGACHVGSLQDSDCRLYNNTSASTSHDLHGGWHDAGDYNKYVNFTFSALMDLMLAYKENPLAFTDNTNIPESGNGIPDLLDEVKYELDWLLRMQQSDGSVLCVIGGGATSPPSIDTQQRLYGPATTSATYTACSMFALGAIVFNQVGNSAYATQLATASQNAWIWAQANPGITFYNSGTIAAGENETNADGLFTRQIASAVFLYDLTGNSIYKTFVENNYQNAHLIQWGYVYPFENEMQDALLYYAALSGVNANVKNDIQNNYSTSVSMGNNDNLPAYTGHTDQYRAWLSDNNYTWNSNKTKACQGNIFQDMLVYHLDTASAESYLRAALGFVNYFHGVNPNSKVYLSNMSNYGAENSVLQFYHSWFENSSALWDEVGVSTYGPPPGFIPGGPNPGYALDGCCPGGCGSSTNNALCNTNVTPPLNQPIQKSYKDFNDSWPVNSWTVTEAGIYTNASYVRLISKYVDHSNSCILTNSPSLNANAGMIVFPNPFNESLSIRIETNSSEDTQLHIFDLNGRIVFSRLLEFTNSKSMTLSTSFLKAGFYVVEILRGNECSRWKVVKE